MCKEYLEKENYCNIGGKWYKCCDRDCDNCEYYSHDINEPSDCYYKMWEFYIENGYVDSDEYIIVEKNGEQMFINSNKLKNF